MLRTLICLSLVGCWTDEELVDGTFTREQWDFMQSFRLPPPEFCPSNPAIANCAAAAALGQRLFFEKKLSGPITITDPLALGPAGATGSIACASCHAPGDPDNDAMAQYFTDTRSQPGNISIGAAYTGHNALSLVNVGFKAVVIENKGCADTDLYCRRAFSWNGRYENAAKVLALAGLKGPAMNGSEQRMADVIRDDAAYTNGYLDAFGSVPGSDDVEVFGNLALAFEAYFRKLISLNSPFDRYLAGMLDGQTTSNRDALTEEQRRGLAIFIGKGMCVECHRGPLLSDLAFHDTGVPQLGLHVSEIDVGLADTARREGRDEPENIGKFLTQPLRNVAKTGPYMHAGQLATLADVIDFYRTGGVAEGFSGVKDPRIQPLEIDDEEARDLEAFLRALTGEPVAKGLRRPN